MFELPGSEEKELRISKSYAVEKLNKSKLQALKAVS
jgi:ATP-dependent Clp protease ATP-binding subunit ClpX